MYVYIPKLCQYCIIDKGLYMYSSSVSSIGYAVHQVLVQATGSEQTSKVPEGGMDNNRKRGVKQRGRR